MDSKKPVSLAEQDAGVVVGVLEFAVEPQGSHPVAEAPGGYGELVGLGGRDDSGTDALSDRFLKARCGGVFGGLGVGVFLGLGELGPEHEPEVRGVLLGEGDVGTDERGKGPNRAVGGRPGRGQFAGQQLETLSRQCGEQGGPVGEVMVGRSRAHPGLPRHPPQADRADALGLDELQARRQQRFTQGAVMVAVPRDCHVTRVRG